MDRGLMEIIMLDKGFDKEYDDLEYFTKHDIAVDYEDNELLITCNKTQILRCNNLTDEELIKILKGLK